MTCTQSATRRRPWTNRLLRVVTCGFVGLALLCTTLAGCSSTGATDTEDGSIVLTEEDWYPTSTPQGAGLQWLYDEYHRTHPNVTIKRTILPGAGDLIPKLLSQSATNSLPDIAIVDNPYLQAFAGTGKVQDLRKDLHGSESDYLPGQKTIGTGPTGELNGIFMGVATLAVYYNKELFEKAGIKRPPQTWAELQADAKKLSGPDVDGFVFGGGQDQCSTWQFNPWQWSAGGTDVPLDSPGNVKALTYWRSLIESGASPVTVVNSCQDDTFQQFAQGRAGMMVNGAWDIAPLDQKKFRFGIFQIPVPTAGQQRVLPLGGEMFTLPTTGDARRQAAAHEFLKWSQTPAVLREFNKRTGYIPAQSALWPRVQHDDPRMAPFIATLPRARGRTDQVGAKYPRWSQAMSTAIGQALLDQKEPAEALHEAQRAYAGN